MKVLLCVIQTPRISFECGLRRIAFAEIQTLESKLLLITVLVLKFHNKYVKICQFTLRMCRV